MRNCQKPKKRYAGINFDKKNSKIKWTATHQNRPNTSRQLLVVTAGLDWWWTMIVCRQTWSEVGGRFVIGVKLNFDCNFVLLFRRKRRVAYYTSKVKVFYTSVANAWLFVDCGFPFFPYWPMNEPSSFIPSVKNSTTNWFSWWEIKNNNNKDTRK